MAITQDDVLKALSTVQEPDLKKDLVTLGMVKDIQIENRSVTFTVVLTTPACPLKEFIRQSCVDAIYKHIGKDVEVTVNLTAEVTKGANNTPLLPKVKNIIAIASGKGGVGKSTVSANLAVALSRAGASVGLIDADIYGPSIPTMFNCEHSRPGVYQEDGKNFIVPIFQYGVKIMSIGFLASPETAVIWRGPMASSALKQFISDTDWGDLDYLLIDLPPGTSDIHLTMVQTIPVTGAIIVTTPQKVALADARKGMQMFRQPQINVPILGIVENMAWFTPRELPDNKYFIFGKGGGEELGKAFDVPVLAHIPLVQGIRESGDEGIPAVLTDEEYSEAFDELAQSVAQAVAIRNASGEKTKKLELIR